MTKIFVTGATGYIGGDALYALVESHPEFEIAALVRDPGKKDQVARQHPSVRLVEGDLDNSAVIEQESDKADIVLNWASSDHVGAANAIVRGLAKHPTDRPGYLVHTSGTGILMAYDFTRHIPLGDESDKVFDDWDNVAEVTSLPDMAPHREVDKIILAAGTQHPQIKTAIVCPPAIYGAGRGAANRRSIQIPVLARETLRRGEGIQVGRGKTRWSNVHVRDLSTLYLLLVEEALSGHGPESKLWGPEGYYFAENGEHVWGEMSEYIAEVAFREGWIKSKEVQKLEKEDVEKIHRYGPYIWGCNSRSRAVRARKLLGWNPGAPSIKDEVLEALRIEKEAM